MPKLGKRLVDATAAAEREIFLFDDELEGFGLRVYPSGRKVYVYQWKRLGKTHRLTLGRHGVITCEQARRLALQAAGAVAHGADPAAERDRRKAEPTVAQLCDRWLKEGCAGKRASTLARDRTRVEAHIKPLVGRLRLAELRRHHVENLVREVAAGHVSSERRGRRGPVATGGVMAAARTLAMLKAILEFAVTRELRPDNPARGVQGPKSEARERLISIEELGRLGRAIEEMEASGSLAWQPAAAIRLLLFTGCRRSEIELLRWEHVDLARRLLILPQTKTGRSHRPLATPAIAVLADLQAMRADPDAPGWVLPSSRGEGPFKALSTAWAAVRVRAGLAGVRLHDLRHNLASVGVASGESLFIIGRVLGHKSTKHTERYAHLAPSPVLAAADRAATAIERALAGKGADGDVEQQGAVAVEPKGSIKSAGNSENAGDS